MRGEPGWVPTYVTLHEGAREGEVGRAKTKADQIVNLGRERRRGRHLSGDGEGEERNAVYIASRAKNWGETGGGGVEACGIAADGGVMWRNEESANNLI